jgi:hypothetical protein
MAELYVTGGNGPENNSELSDRPYSEASEAAHRYADRLDRRNEKLATLQKASRIVERAIKEAPDMHDFED